MIWEQLLRRVDATGDRCAVQWEGRSISYRQLASLVDALAEQRFDLGAGIPRRALIKQSGSFAVLLSVLSCWRAGVTPVLMRESATAAQVEELAKMLHPITLMTAPVQFEQLSPGRSSRTTRHRMEPELEGLVINTSGTTGAPKLVALPAESVRLNAVTIGAMLRLTPDDRVAVNTPLTYAYGLVGGAVAGLWAGASVHLFSPTPLPLALAQIRSQGLTIVQGPPTLMRLFLAYWNGKPFPSVRMLTTGGELMPPAVVAGLDAQFPNAEKHFIYGMTEAGPRISHDDLSTGRYKDGCVGKPFDHIDWHLEPLDAPGRAPNVGRLVLRGPSMFLGYLQASGKYEGLDDAGFFHSSDLVSCDEDGRLCFHGRIDRLFKTGGKLINPASIERILLEHPGVADAHCHAEPHAMLGLVPVAHVVARPGCTPTEAELKAHCTIHLDSHAVPQRLVMVGELKINESGKAMRPSH